MWLHQKSQEFFTIACCNLLHGILQKNSSKARMLYAHCKMSSTAKSLNIYFLLKQNNDTEPNCNCFVFILNFATVIVAIEVDMIETFQKICPQFRNVCDKTLFTYIGILHFTFYRWLFTHQTQVLIIIDINFLSNTTGF